MITIDERPKFKMEVLNVIVRGGWVFDDLKLHTYIIMVKEDD